MANANPISPSASKDAVRKVDYWYALVPDAPGAPNDVLQRLARAKVHLTAFLAFPAGAGKSQVDLVPTEPATFERDAKAAGVSLSSTRKRALLVQGSDRLGALVDHLARLAAQKIHVVASTAVATSGGGYGFLVWVKQDAVDEAAKALGA